MKMLQMLKFAIHLHHSNLTNIFAAASFLFVADLYGYQHEWLGYIMKLLPVAPGCNQLVVGSTHGLKNNTQLTRFFNPTKKKSVRWRHCQLGIGGPSVLCLTISRNAFVSRCIWLKIIVNLEWIGNYTVLLISKKLRSICGCILYINHGTTHCIFQS